MFNCGLWLQVFAFMFCSFWIHRSVLFGEKSWGRVHVHINKERRVWFDAKLAESPVSSLGCWHVQALLRERRDCSFGLQVMGLVWDFDSVAFLLASTSKSRLLFSLARTVKTANPKWDAISSPESLLQSSYRRWQLDRWGAPHPIFEAEVYHPQNQESEGRKTERERKNGFVLGERGRRTGSVKWLNGFLFI